jgi:hypothetical protein
MTIENVIKNRIETDTCQWVEGGKIYKLSELSREDLMQVAAQSMDLIDRMDTRITSLCQGIEKDMGYWHRGQPIPHDPEIDEPPTWV